LIFGLFRPFSGTFGYPLLTGVMVMAVTKGAERSSSP
jgi:hypothetical protein